MVGDETDGYGGDAPFVKGRDDGQHFGSSFKGIDELGIEDPLVLWRPRNRLPGVRIDHACKGVGAVLAKSRLGEF